MIVISGIQSLQKTPAQQCFLLCGYLVYMGFVEQGNWIKLYVPERFLLVKNSGFPMFFLGL
jgi:hypothetical protein